ncbi:IS110 family transposase [Calderihabitans maritimus]|uniref:ISChy1, transposase n=1 Tax=Calderihabitans maritimus TaxID=1246530 RepID=A0A1Z5HR06_9FIRM|nr:IS110 family transposase [Calderihabitans maritimus]GAW91807.1 ISChy1, transposase [Calderihabitans maritimus]
MAQVIFAGIDISALKCDLVCLDEQGHQLAPAKSFPNNREGASGLVEMLDHLARKFNIQQLHIGLEATSVYGIHLREFLLDASQLKAYPTEVYEINPVMVAGFKKAFGARRPKTDALDAYVIAERVRFGHLVPYRRKTMVTEPLRQLTRLRLHLVELLTAEQNRALNLLFLKFSNYHQDKPFSQTFGKSSLAVLQEFTPDELVEMPLEDLVDFIQSHGNNRLIEPGEMAKTLKQAARRAYRLNPKMLEACQVALSLTLQNIDHLKRQLKQLDKVICRELEAIPQTLTSVKGLGPVSAAGIIAEIGDIKRFKNQAALAQYAGLTWTRYQSGDFDAEERRLTKSGNRYLRYYLVQAANSLRVHNEEYKAYYQKKYHEVTKHQHKRALVLTARKLVRLVFALLSKGQIYKGTVIN